MVNTVILAAVFSYLQEAQDWTKKLTSTQRKEYWHVWKWPKKNLHLWSTSLNWLFAATFEILGVELTVEVCFPKQAHIKAKEEVTLSHITCTDVLCHKLIYWRKVQIAFSTAHVSSDCCGEEIVLVDSTLCLQADSWVLSINGWKATKAGRGVICRSQMILATARENIELVNVLP